MLPPISQHLRAPLTPSWPESRRRFHGDRASPNRIGSTLSMDDIATAPRVVPLLSIMQRLHAGGDPNPRRSSRDLAWSQKTKPLSPRRRQRLRSCSSARSRGTPALESLTSLRRVRRADHSSHHARASQREHRRPPSACARVPPCGRPPCARSPCGPRCPCRSRGH